RLGHTDDPLGQHQRPQHHDRRVRVPPAGRWLSGPSRKEAAMSNGTGLDMKLEVVVIPVSDWFPRASLTLAGFRRSTGTTTGTRAASGRTRRRARASDQSDARGRRMRTPRCAAPAYWQLALSSEPCWNRTRTSDPLVKNELLVAMMKVKDKRFAPTMS